MRNTLATDEALAIRTETTALVMSSYLAFFSVLVQLYLTLQSTNGGDGEWRRFVLVADSAFYEPRIRIMLPLCTTALY